MTTIMRRKDEGGLGERNSFNFLENKENNLI